ncbi:hypothetical protein [Rubellimicrobium roseum]|uniref:DUF998 domain-containing protein n=1 Tax=Rubellimicrobium roseum TaxID=687525 RepID=A0A5C4N9L6_9RHOB|nr:hypothetical protein [Rubellimicrobium roseum]TNC71534.1 hypothetical protein FHG71_11380 [Rubellimicrobium roseum]
MVAIERSLPETGLVITPRLVLGILTAVIAVLVGMHVKIHLCWYEDICGPSRSFDMTYGYLFDLGSELSVPTWFSTVQLAAVALALVVAGAFAPTGRWGWRLLSLLFVYLSVDEETDMHGFWSKHSAGIQVSDATEGFNWIIPGVLIVAAVAVAFLPWFLRLPSRTRKLFVTAAVIYVVGGLVMEGLGGLTADEHFSNPAYLAVATIEEALEMFGISVMLYAVLDYLRGQDLAVRIAD